MVPSPAVSSRYPRHRCPSCGRLVAKVHREQAPEFVHHGATAGYVHRLRPHTDPATGDRCAGRALWVAWTDGSGREWPLPPVALRVL